MGSVPASGKAEPDGGGPHTGAGFATQLEQMRYENMEDMATLHSEIQEELGDEETAGEPEDDSNN